MSAFNPNIVPYNSAGTEIGTAGDPIRTDPTGTTTQPISAASLPLPTGAATAAKQPALGTAGTASADVITVQGVASMTPIAVSGTVTATPPTATAAANTQVSVSTNVTLKASNASRRGLILYNTGSKLVYVKFGATATPTDFTIPLPAGQVWEMSEPIYTGIIDAVASSGTQVVNVSELT